MSGTCIFSFANCRTGQHGIFNWLLPQGDFAHFDFNEFFVSEDSKVMLSKHNWFNAVDPSDGSVKREKDFSKLENKKDFIYSFEEVDLSFFDKYNLIDCSEASKSKNIFAVCIMRDPFNWIASMLRHADNSPFGYHVLPDKVRIIKDAIQNLGEDIPNNIGGVQPSRINQLKSQIKQALGLEPPQVKSCPMVFISFNEWFTSVDYRMQISNSLGLKFTDKNLNKVSSNGNGGSSFDKVKFQDNAQKMKVLDRWKDFRGDSRFNRLLDDELIDLSREYFKFCPV